MSHLKLINCDSLTLPCIFRSLRLITAAGFMLFGLISTDTASAQGDLLITPRRVVFEGSKRSMDLNLVNAGKDTAVYAISLVQIRMKEDGGFETINEPDPGQRFSDRFIRFFPRTVTLGPNEAQTVKVQLTRTNELTPGEYRSHFYFRSVPDRKPLGEEEKKRDTTTISVRITPIFGITIPVIIRVGESNARVTLSDFSFKFINDTVPFVVMTFNRIGNMSVYGDIAVDHISPQGKVTRVGIANGVAVYTPNAIRKLQFNLNNVPGVDFRAGKLRVTYSASSDVKPAKFAEAEVLLH
jgi:P pilus assembly chaperone PapD